MFLKPILKQLGAIDGVMPYALTYTSIYITFSIFNVFNVTMNNIVSSEGAAKTAMCALMTGAVLNVALDPILIYRFDLGVAGAAIATAISQAVSTLVYLCYIFQKKSMFSHDVFVSLSCHGESERGMYSWRVPTRDLLCACNHTSSADFGIKWNTLRAADCGHTRRSCDCLYDEEVVYPRELLYLIPIHEEITIL